MKKILIIILLFGLILIIGGCKQQEVVCNKPYILVGTECCLDQNDNSVCDSDETATVELTTTTLTKETTITSINVETLPGVKKLSLDEMKAVVYQEIRRYVPQSTVGGFACKNYWILISTQDYIGENAYPIYADYDIDKVALENLANEILGNC